MVIVDIAKLSELTDAQITLVIGTFDILHTGHIDFLKRAKEVGGGKLLVAVIPDSVVRSKKGDDRPIIKQEERAEILDALKPVDYVYVATETTVAKIAENAISLVCPRNAVASNDDWEGRSEEWSFAGTELILIDKIPDQSTTKIVQKIRG